MSVAATEFDRTMSRPRQLEIDPLLIFAVASLLLLGVVMVASASMSVAEREYGSAFFYLQRHAAHLVVGLLLGLVVLGIPSEWWRAGSPVALMFAFALLLVVLLPGVGHEVNGSVRWIRLGPLNLQVSEPARLLIMIYLCGYLLRHGDAVRASLIGFAKPLVVVALACALLLAQPDFGAATVLLATCLGIMFLAGVRFSHFLLLFVLAALALAALALSSDYRIARLKGFLDPWADRFAGGFQLTQSLIAIGSGDVGGTGLGASVQKLFYLPEAHTDFVFAVLAEELGLVGVVTIVALYAVLVWRAMLIGAAAQAGSRYFQALLAGGIGIWFGIQSSVNIGVNMGLLPTKGLTLPLISYGGSSLVVSLMAVALLFRIHHENVNSLSAASRRGAKKPARARRGRK
jgi:cell division protein FtsW